MKKLLTICIPSIVERNKHLNRLLKELEKQIKENNCEKLIEIIVFVDNRDTPLYKKCNSLLNEVRGEYMVGLGDDDWIAPTYIKDIMDIVKIKVYDHITFNMVYRTDKKDKIMEFSHKYKHFSHVFPLNISIRYGTYTKDEDCILYKNKKIIKNKFLIFVFLIIFKNFVKKSTCPTWTTMVLKSDIAKQVKYEDVNSEEDMLWALTVSQKNLIKKEYNIKKNLYYYLYDKKFSSINKETVLVKEIDYVTQKIDKKIVKFI